MESNAGLRQFGPSAAHPGPPTARSTPWPAASSLEQFPQINPHQKPAQRVQIRLIDDTAGLSIGELRAKARRLKAQHDIQLIVIDYLNRQPELRGNGKPRLSDLRECGSLPV